MKTNWIVGATVIFLAACGGESKTATNNGDANNGTQNNGVANNGGETNGHPGNNGADATVFYYEHVKPIVDGKCVDCHSDGGIGPFALDTYEAVKAVAPLVQASVVNKVMPPYIYDPSCREPQFDPTLSDEQIQTISDWVDQGTAEGNPEAEGDALEIARPPAPDFDTVLAMPVAYTPSKSPDDYRCFIVDWPHDARRFVTGFGVEPGQEAMVHHVIAFLAQPDFVDDAEALDAAEEGPGYTCFGGPGFDDFYWLGSWAPGGLFARSYPEGTGLEIPPGSKVVVQIHYNTLSEEPKPDKTTVRFETATTVEKQAFWLPWANPTWLNGTAMRIRAGEADVMHRFMLDPTQFLSDGQSIDIWAGGLHMHMLGTSATTWIQRGDGTQDCLADIPRWDFNWQSGVSFDEPVKLRPGDRLALECHWDNTTENQPVVDGRRLTPEDRFWGEGTTDEMCLGVYYVTMGGI